jgi:hypothetical protein
MTVTKMYENYGKTSDENIREFLSKIKLVRKGHKGINSVFGYYQISEATLQKILGNPRGVAYNMDEIETQDTPLSNLKSFISIPFICKSSSRFFLKADIGEVFDQIETVLIEQNKIKAIDISLGSYQEIDGTDGEHFLMSVILLEEINEEAAA